MTEQQYNEIIKRLERIEKKLQLKTIIKGDRTIVVDGRTGIKHEE